MQSITENGGTSGVPVKNPPMAPIYNIPARQDKKVSPWHTEKLFFLAGLPLLQRIQGRLSRRSHPGSSAVSLPLSDFLRVSQVKS